MPVQIFTITASAVPSAPTGLSALSVTGTTSVQLTWMDIAVNETNYKVLRRTGSNPFAVLSGATALSAGTTSFLDTLTAASTTYDYQVIAYNGSGDSPASNTATATTNPTPQPGPEEPPGVSPPAALYQWIDAAGDSHDISDVGGTAVLLGARGLLMPSFALTETETPFNDGSRITGVRVPARDIDLPILVEAADTTTLRTALRTLVRWFDPHRGDGILRVTAPDGTQRDLNCRYAGGLDNASDEPSQAGDNWWVVAITLHAADPYFYSTAPTNASFSTAAPVPFFPFFPLQLSASSVVGSASANNDGDVEAWPIWTINGPSLGVTLTNATSGQTLVLSTVLGAGESVVIDTRPGKKSVTRNAGGNLTNALGDVSPTSSLWPLQVGENDLDIVLSGSSLASSVGLTYVPRHLSI